MNVTLISEFSYLYMKAASSWHYVNAAAIFLIKENIYLMLERSSGILLPISSLPSKYGIGTLGKEAFDFVSELVKDNVPISESIIKNIHYLVLADKKEDRGVYRRVPVRIMGTQYELVQPYL